MKIKDNELIESVVDNSIDSYYKKCPVCNIELEDGECPECGFSLNIGNNELSWESIEN